jgi:predicted Ser/Thr protein kinase
MKNYVLEFKEIIMQGQLGEGSYGVVYKGEWRNQKVAGKEFFFGGKN